MSFKKRIVLIGALVFISLLVLPATGGILQTATARCEAENPAIEEPAVGRPLAAERVAEEPVAEERVAEEPVTEGPEAEEPEAEDPVPEEQTEVGNGEADPTEDMEPREEDQTLLSETEVNTFLVRFYDGDDTLLREVSVAKGSPAEKPEKDPKQAGQVFSHWYLVDKNLRGDARLRYDFKQAIMGPTCLKAQYLPADEPAAEEPVAEEQVMEDPAVEGPETDEPVAEETTQQETQTPDDPEGPQDEQEALRDAAEKAVVRLSVALTVEGGQASDGAYHARLTGPSLPETGVTVANEGERFSFPEMSFTAKDVGVHVFRVQALVQEPLPLHTYDLHVQEVQVEVHADETGRLTAVANYPQGADHLTIAHSVQAQTPTVRVYANLEPGQIIAYGDEVIFSAEMEHCGQSPRIQWQYSPDNQNWADIAGGNGLRLPVRITPSNAAGYWRVAVTITD